MRSLLSRCAALLLCACILLPWLPAPARAESAVAADLRSSTTISGSGYNTYGFLLDNDLLYYYTSTENAFLRLTNPAGMGSLYLLFDRSSGEYTVTDNATGNSIVAGQADYLHQFIDLEAAFGYLPTDVTLQFGENTVRLGEIYVFGGGKTPDFVQKWSASLDGGADILLFIAHGDDDQLFFAGLLPLYAGQLGVKVQVVYLTDHRSGMVEYIRLHEMLDGLWATGVTAYPVFGTFADFRWDNLEETYLCYEPFGTTQQDLLGFAVEQIRRFQPQVVVSHDINGEYGHGMHMVCADLMIKSLPLIGDASAFPASAAAYGTWEIQKLYLHLYEENAITIDYDQPLSKFGGLTAFQVSQQLGFPCHFSQQGIDLKDWLYGVNNEITKASQLTLYSPCQFGLYYSAVGEDVAKNDFLENITTYQQQEEALRDQQAAAAVMGLIDSLVITLDSAPEIAAIYDAFDALTETQQALVTNWSVLAEKEAAYASLVQAAEEEANQAAADAVSTMIADLTVTEDSGDAIAAVRAAYNALTSKQKLMVTNYVDLVAAELAYADLTQKPKPDTTPTSPTSPTVPTSPTSPSTSTAPRQEPAPLPEPERAPNWVILAAMGLLLVACMAILFIRMKKVEK